MNKACYFFLFFLFLFFQKTSAAQETKRKLEISKRAEKKLLGNINPDEVITLMKKAADRELANPTGKNLNTWESGPFYIGLMALYKTTMDSKYLQEIKGMGEKLNWKPQTRPYDENVLTISQAFLELYQITGDKYIVDKTRFVMDAPKNGWSALKEAIHPNGKLGYVQEVGDSPTDVKYEDSETYGTGAFLLAGSEFYKMLKKQKPYTLNDLSQGGDDREYTVSLLLKISNPVLLPLSQNKLHEVFPRKKWETRESDIQTSPLQAFGRTLSGMAPWLSLGKDGSGEGLLRAKYADLARKCLVNATDPHSPDYMFDKPTQERIVHAAYIAYPLLIAPRQLWEPLSQTQKDDIIRALKTYRAFKPNESNWLLFPAIIESAIWKFTGSCDQEPIKYAITKHKEWYLGDGVYGDGPSFHWDYYNSFVIHPLLLETLRTCKEMGMPVDDFLKTSIQRGQRYSEILEHLISPEGTFPVIGRSSVYRIAVLQQLGYMAFRENKLPASLNPVATRSAITAVIKRMMQAPGTFDENGWLNAGIVGEQVGARDSYNYTGALYMCALGLSHLGIHPDDLFWTEPSQKWTQQRIWDGEILPDQSVFK